MSAPAEKSLILIIYLALAASTAIVYWQVCNFEFINYDDNQYVYENRQVLSGLTADSMAWAFKAGHAGNWHPVTWLSLMLDAQLFGPHPRWFHLVNLLFHIANTLFLFAVLRKMTAALWPSVFVAAAFALHPMHVQSVAWIAERKDVLSTFFLMLSLPAYSVTQNRSALRLFLSLAFFAFGLMAKPMLVTVPFILLVLDYWPLNRFDMANQKNSAPRQSFKLIIAEKLPFLALSIIFSIITFIVQRNSGAVPDTAALPLQGRIANALLSCGLYIGKLFWPANLAVIYPLNPKGTEILPIILSAVLLIGISLVVLYFARKLKFLFVGWFWFLIILLPVIGLVQTGPQAYADRYTYISYIGLFIMIAWGASEIIRVARSKRSVAVICISAIIGLTALGICSYRQAEYWKNSIALFSHTRDATENNYIACSNLGDELRKAGNLSLAIESYKKSLQILPDYPNAVLGLGSSLADMGDLDGAISYFEKTLQLKTDPVWLAAAHANIAVALRSRGNLDESIAHFKKAILLNPHSSQLRNSFAKTLIRKNDLDEAQQQLNSAINLNPNWVEPVNTLALLIAIHPEMKNRDIGRALELARARANLLIIAILQYSGLWPQHMELKAASRMRSRLLIRQFHLRICLISPK